MKSFKRAFHSLLLIEGGYADHPFDKGGETMYGITRKTAEANGIKLDSMESLTQQQAEDIYKKEYWDKVKGDEIAGVAETVAKILFEVAVHRGVKSASIFFQKALNAFNNQGKLYADIAEDGIIGKGSLEALKTLFSIRNQKDAVHCIAMYILVEHAHALNEFAIKDKTQEAFMFGWYLKRIKPNWEN